MRGKLLIHGFQKNISLLQIIFQSMSDPNNDVALQGQALAELIMNSPEGRYPAVQATTMLVLSRLTTSRPWLEPTIDGLHMSG